MVTTNWNTSVCFSNVSVVFEMDCLFQKAFNGSIEKYPLSKKKTKKKS